MATERGPFNCVESPVPARVLMTPCGVIRRMRLLRVSAIYQLPLESTAIAEGEDNCAAVAGPPSPPKLGGVPLPAMMAALPPLGIFDTNAVYGKKISPAASIFKSLADPMPVNCWTTVPK